MLNLPDTAIDLSTAWKITGIILFFAASRCKNALRRLGPISQIDYNIANLGYRISAKIRSFLFCIKYCKSKHNTWKLLVLKFFWNLPVWEIDHFMSYQSKKLKVYRKIYLPKFFVWNVSLFRFITNITQYSSFFLHCKFKSHFKMRYYIPNWLK